MRFVFMVLLLFTAPAFALSFTPDEVRIHKTNIELITDTAARCLEATYQEHLDFFAKYKVSKFYGDRRPDYDTLKGRISALRAYGYSPEQAAAIAPQQRGMSCVGLTMECLGKGFAAGGQSETWKKIYAQVKSVGLDGTELQKVLRGLGWKVLYWNPNPGQNAAWDLDDREKNPLTPGKKWMGVWGGHADRYREVMNSGTYYKVPVDDAQTLVNFGEVQPTAFTALNFFVGTAHSGYHVFPGRNGQVIEAHSMRELNSIHNLEYSEFNPLKTGGGPRWTPRERYRSGMIAVPPAR